MPIRIAGRLGGQSQRQQRSTRTPNNETITGEEAQELVREAGKCARRWVVERSHSWPHNCRRLLLRWEKKLAHDPAFLHFVCAVIVIRAAGVLG
jgi:transposase